MGTRPTPPFDARKIGPHLPCMDVYLVFITAAIFILVQIARHFITLEQKTNHVIKEKTHTTYKYTYKWSFDTEILVVLVKSHSFPQFWLLKPPARSPRGCGPTWAESCPAACRTPIGRPAPSLSAGDPQGFHMFGGKSPSSLDGLWKWKSLNIQWRWVI